MARSRMLARLASRAFVPSLGNQAPVPSTSGGGVKAATGSVTYSTPGQPLTTRWDPTAATEQAYFGSIYVLRCFRTIADTIAGLPFRTGKDPTSPQDFTTASPMAQLLGPAPGAPNPGSTARTLWAWSIVQFLISGKWAWEQQRPSKGAPPVALWPLVSAYLNPIPTQGGDRWWQSFSYDLPTGSRPLTYDQVFYAWRPSARDYRQPESDLEAAKLPISIAVALDHYQWALLKNNMVAAHIVISPPFEESDQRRAWQEQFTAEHSGFDNAGKTIFAEADNDYDENGKLVDQAAVQVIKLAQSADDAALIQLSQQSKIDITIAAGVPMSLIGNASQRTYANSDAEYRNFWTIRVLPLLSELQDYVNTNLAPQFGDDMLGWFDLTHVVALQPPTPLIMPAQVQDLVASGIASPSQVGELLGIQNAGNTDIDTTTAPVGEESSQTGPGGAGARSLPAGFWWENRGINTATLANNSVWRLRYDRPHIEVRSAPEPPDVEGIVRDALGQFTDQLGALVERETRAFNPDEPRGPHGEWSGLGSATKFVASALGVHHGKLSSHPAFAQEHQRIAGAIERNASPTSLLHQNFTSELMAAKHAQKKGQMAAAARHLATATAAEEALKARGEAPMFGNHAVERSRELESRYDTSPLGEGQNWLKKVGGLPPFIRAIAHALIRNGHSESEAIQIALGAAKKWAHGGGHVTPKTVAKSAATVASWEAKKAASHSRDLTEGGSAGALLPKVGPPLAPVVEGKDGVDHIGRHRFVGPDPAHCVLCGLPRDNPVHEVGSREQRHRGPEGHHGVPSGHIAGNPARAATVHRRQFTTDTTGVATQMAEALRTSFGQQQKATLDRLSGKRGRQMFTRAAVIPGQLPPAGAAASVDAAQLYDAGHWAAQMSQALQPIYGAMVALTGSRISGMLGEVDGSAAGVTTTQALAQRAQALGRRVAGATLSRLAQQLATGVTYGESLDQLTDRLRSVFAHATSGADAMPVPTVGAPKGQPSTADTIAASEAPSAMNQAAHVYAASLPPGSVGSKRWVTGEDPRASHAEANGQEVPVDQPFRVGGFRLEHPGSRSAPPQEWAGCNCSTMYLPPVAERSRESRVGPKGYVHGWIKVGDMGTAAAKATPASNRYVGVSTIARQMRSEAIANEPRVSADLRDVQASTASLGSKMVGTQFAIKGQKSLERKIREKIDAKTRTSSSGREIPTTPSQAGNRVHDSLRYTMTFDHSAYSQGVRSAVGALKQKGYSFPKERVKNTWAGNVYRGLNTTMVAPNGQRVELQFHTPKSFSAKQATHGPYEEHRAKGTRVTRKLALNEQMASIARGAGESPGGAEKLTPGMIAEPLPPYQQLPSGK